jgi:hypothetical protein
MPIDVPEEPTVTRIRIKQKLLLSFLIVLFVIALIPMNLYPSWFQKISDGKKGYDLIQHFIVFGLLFLILWRALGKKYHCLKTWVLTLFFSVGIGGVLELVQLVSGRNGNWLDFAANGGGVLFAATCVFMANKFKKKIDG